MITKTNRNYQLYCYMKQTIIKAIKMIVIKLKMNFIYSIVADDMNSFMEDVQ